VQRDRAGGAVLAIAEDAAPLSEPFAGHAEGIPRALRVHLPLALSDHRHDPTTVSSAFGRSANCTPLSRE